MGKTLFKDFMGTGGHWYEKIFVDYPKKPRSEHGLGIPLFHGHTRLPLPTAWPRLANQNRSPDPFLT